MYASSRSTSSASSPRTRSGELLVREPRSTNRESIRAINEEFFAADAKCQALRFVHERHPERVRSSLHRGRLIVPTSDARVQDRGFTLSLV